VPCDRAAPAAAGVADEAVVVGAGPPFVSVAALMVRGRERCADGSLPDDDAGGRDLDESAAAGCVHEHEIVGGLPFFLLENRERLIHGLPRYTGMVGLRQPARETLLHGAMLGLSG